MSSASIMDGLNEIEQHAYQLLKKVDSKTFLGHCIGEWMKKDTPESLRATVKQIHSQAQDNIPKMREALGNETFDAVMKCVE